MENVRIPPLVSIRRALEIYCDRDSLGNAEIKELFGCCDATAIKLKRMARIDNSGRPYCVGDRFYSCRLLEDGKSGGHIYEGRLEELMTEDEYQKSKEAEHNG